MTADCCGRVLLEQGKYTGVPPGRVLRNTDYHANRATTPTGHRSGPSCPSPGNPPGRDVG
jgi:hypothetical protein